MDLKIEGYRILNKIYSSEKTVICNAVNSLEKAVMIKCLSKEYPSTLEIENLKKESKILGKISNKYIIKQHQMIDIDNSVVLVLEDFNGDSLEKICKKEEITILEKLQIALKVIKGLAAIHKLKLVHRDINPSNILYDIKSKELKIIDFELAQQYNHKSAKEKLEGTIEYISPEQTGRLDCEIDYRSDYYSLGMTLYKLFNGELPFISSDKNEMIHFHIAKTPISPSKINPKIPEEVSKVILKLLEKMPKDRYQSNIGIRKDILKLIKSLKKNTELKNFVVGENDIIANYDFNYNLLVKEKNKKIIEEKVTQLRKRKSDFHLFTGEKGTGKSLLGRVAQEIAKENSCNFIKSKFDEYRKNIPLSGILDGLQNFVKDIYMEDQEIKENWKFRFLKNLGNNGKLITELIPELTDIIGEQPEIEKLPRNETLNRFNLTFYKFITSLATQETPLVIYIDDIQCADYTSLSLIKNIISDFTTKHVLMILAAEENNMKIDVDTSLMLNDLANQGIIIERSSIGNFSNDEIINIFKNSFNYVIDNIEELAKITFNKTQGNPFLIKEFIDSLVEEELIFFNYKTRRWIWKEELQNKVISKDVLVRILNKIDKLENSSLELIKNAACIGNTFRLDILFAILDNNKEYSKEIDELKKEAIIFKTKKNGQNYYRFSHKRIREAVLSLIKESELRERTLQIARTCDLLMGEVEKEKFIFDLASYYSFGIELITDKQEIEKTIQLNIKAAEKAAESGSYNISKGFLKKAIDVMPENFWEEKYSLALYLYSLAVEISYLLDDIKYAEEIEKIAINKARDILEKVNIYEKRIGALTTTHKMEEAIDAGIEALQLLNVKLKKKPNYFLILKYLYMISKYLKKGIDLKQISSDNKLEDEYKISYVKILKTMGSASYYYDQILLLQITLKTVVMTIKEGYFEYSNLAFCSLGMLLCSVRGQYDVGYSISESAVNLSDEIDPTVTNVKCRHIFYSLTQFWKKDIRSNVYKIRENYEKCLEIGELEYAGYFLIVYLRQRFFSANNFQELQDELDSLRKNIFLFKNSVKKAEINIVSQSIENIATQNSNLDSLEGERFQESRLNNIDSENSVLIATCFLFKAVLAFFYNENTINADGYLKKCKDHIKGLGGGYVTLLFQFYYAFSKLTKNIKTDETTKIIKKYYKYSLTSPNNFYNKYYLLKAEVARIDNNKDEAMRLYENAIKESQKSGFTIEKVIAIERAAMFYYDSGYSLIGNTYFKRCHHLCEKIGASSKVKLLENRYKDIFKKSELEFEKTSTTFQSTITSTVSDKIDNETIIRSTQILSKEIILENLLKELMKIIFENAGAEKAVLLLEKEDGLFIEALGNTKNKEIDANISVKLEESDLVPKRIINYVYRFKKNVVLENAEANDQFGYDTYILKEKTKSVLCIPIKNKNSVTGMIYLENNLLNGAFSKERINFLEIFTNQISVSLENAKLYSKLENSEEKYKTLVNNIQEGVFILHNKKIIYGNQAFFNILGINSDEVIGKSFLKYISQKYSLEMADFYNKKVNHLGEKKELEIEIIGNSGKEVPVILKAELISYDGQPAIEGTLQDITERKVAEEIEKKYRNHLENLVQERTKDVKNLLDNAGQGFLSFGTDLLIKPEYSLECEKIFQKDLNGKNVVTTIFYEQSQEEKKFLIALLKKILSLKKGRKLNNYLNLLPREIKISDNYVTLEYKCLQQEREKELMIIATDVTDRKSLEEKMEEEKNNLRLVVKALIDTDGIVRSTQDYITYFEKEIYDELKNSNDILEILTVMYRKIHTYKGDLAQWNMNYTTIKLNEVENDISNLLQNVDEVTIDEVKNFINRYDFIKWIELEKDIIRNRIGKDIFTQTEKLLIDKNNIKEIETLIISEFYFHEYSTILPKIRKLRYSNLQELFNGYEEYVINLADRLGKKVNKITILGNPVLIDKDIYYEFLKSLIHIFRNILDHGIENPEDRIIMGKEESGNIVIETDQQIDEILLSIRDDGGGLDIEKIKEKGIRKGIITEKDLVIKSEEMICAIIFEDQFSTKEKSDTISGRGVGLSSVRSNIENLGGTITVESKNGVGTEFLIRLPYIENTPEEKSVSQKILLNIMRKVFKNMLKDDFDIDILKVINFQTEEPELDVDDITALINIRGMISAKAIISINYKLAKDLMRKSLLITVKKPDENRYIEGVIAEILNTVIGNSTKELFEKDILVNFDPPMLFYGKKGSVRSSGNSVIGERLIAKDGEFSLGLLI